VRQAAARSGESATPVIGCIADDFTGGSDVAAALRRTGLRTALYFDQPGATPLPPCDAVVIGLKIRTADRAEAVSQALDAYRWLEANRVPRVYYKYCSTFDSTDDGNIGPIGDALLTATGSQITVICPASPVHGRTLYQGHLFVGDRLLSESSMSQHPLTPMGDSDIVRVLGRQTHWPVGGIFLDDVAEGSEGVSQRLDALAASGARYAVVDAVTDDDLRTVATATAQLRLITGGAGLAAAMARLAVEENPPGATEPVELPTGPTLVLAGSCSAATRAQITHAQAHMASYRIDPGAAESPEQLEASALDWLGSNLGSGPLLMYSSADAQERAAVGEPYSRPLAEVIEHVHGRLAAAAVDRGVQRIVVAGGETSGTVVQSLGVKSVRVLDEQDAGVPWCLAADREDGRPVALLLKSGNFGQVDLLSAASLRERA
jgi:uncharacterized protein YgbK (DUF1537 family)